MLEPEANDECTILDYLNEDCWRAVLQYVPVRVLIRTERASSRWQEIVLMYLQGVHIIIEQDYEHETGESEEIHQNQNTCSFNFSDSNLLESFECWAKKLGTSVVATYCNSLKSLAIFKEYCPNIEALDVAELIDWDVHAPDQLLPYNLHDNFKLIQRVSFMFMRCISDRDVSQFISEKALKKLEIHYCDQLTGLCFIGMNWSKLQTFELDFCKALKWAYMFPAIDRLGELRKLSLVDIDDEILEQIQLVLDKMPKLECLTMQNSNTQMSCRASEPLCRLSRLKLLRVSFRMGDSDVAGVLRCCQELTTLLLWNCQRMAPGFVERLCRQAGARLTTLGLGHFYYAHDDEVVALVRGCPQLTSLTVSGAALLTRALPERAAAARREASPGRPLRLDLTSTNLTREYEKEGRERGFHRRFLFLYKEMRTKYEGLILVLCDTDDEGYTDDEFETDNEDEN